MPYNLLQISIFIIGTILIIAGTYLATYLITSRQSKIYRSRYIKIHDQTKISRKHRLMVVEVASQYYLIGVSRGQFTRIDALDSSLFTEKERQIAAEDLSFLGTGANAARNSKRIQEIVKKNQPEA